MTATVIPEAELARRRAERERQRRERQGLAGTLLDDHDDDGPVPASSERKEPTR
jgi:hypothetical protein